MENNPKKVLDDINKKISQMEIFKFNRESLVQALILASNKTIVAVMLTNSNSMLIDHIVDQYRTVLKFIFSVDNINGPKPQSMDEVIIELSKLIIEFGDKYNHIRNYLDQCIIGNREFKINEEEKLYYEENYDSSSHYARMLDKVKEFPSEGLKNKKMMEITSYITYEGYNKVNPLKDIFFNSMMDDYIKISWLDSEIKFEHDFGDFKYSDLIKFCAALKLIADIYYCISLAKRDYVRIDKESFIYRLSKLTGLTKEKVKFFLDYQTYNYNYQKDKITLIQGLIEINGAYYFSPITINLGLLPVKMYRLLTDLSRDKYEKDFSIIAKEKEKQMTSEIISALDKYDIKLKTNYKIKNGNKDVAEYDMLVYDNQRNNLYICEFKWYYVGDGEKEHKFLDKKINEAIKYRKNKDYYILNNPQVVCKEVFENDKVNKVYELLISQNYPGHSNTDMCVIDYETLQLSVKQHNSFDELMKYFLSREFKESIQVVNELRDIEYEGYKFRFNLICQK